MHAWHAAGQSIALATIASTMMMAAMMAPTVAPWIGAYHRFSTATYASRPSGAAVFAGGYLAVWAGFGLVLVLVQRAIDLPPGSGRLLLLGAGLYQLSPLKRACLRHCRNPLSFLLARWRDGPVSAFHLGFRHGAYCLGCCWALMATASAMGLMSLWWMAALTIVTFAEQVLPWGARLRAPVGIALLVAAAWPR